MSIPSASARPKPLPRPFVLDPRDGLVVGGLIAVLLLFQTGSLPIVLVSAAGFVLLAWFRLDLALLAVVVAAPFYMPVGNNPFPPRELLGRTIALPEYAILCCAGGWLLRFGSRRLGINELKSELSSSLGKPVVIFTIASVISLFGAVYLRVALHEFRTVVLEPVLLFFMIVTTWRSRIDLTRAALTIVVVGLGVSLFAIYHYTFVGIVEATGGVQRVLAIYHSPNQLALLLGRLVSFTLGLALVSRQWRVLTFGSAAIMLVALTLTYSRGAWIGVAASVLVVLLLEGRRRLAIAAGLVGVGVIGVLAATRLQRILAFDTAFRRLYLWESAVNMIRDHPLLGVGLDNFLYYYRDRGYRLATAWQEPDLSHPHNLVLDYWTRIGVLGLISLIWLQAAFWRAGLWLRHQLPNPDQAVVVAAMASMVDFLVHGMIDNSYFLPDLAICFWLAYGLLRVATRVAGERELTQSPV